jgi:PhzF family phenazine biosynthesis protein
VRRRFRQVDVFAPAPYVGNPLAVVLDGEGLSDGEMQAVAAWTNLSETTFVLPASTAGADYLVRIFTPFTELPFAGHPTIGTCHAWLEAGGVPAAAERVVQQCGAGLVTLRRGERLAFAAPPLVRSGPVDQPRVEHVADLLGLAPEEIVAAEWVDNGPGFLAVLLGDVERVLALRPGPFDEFVGVVALHEAGADEAIEVRAFFPKDGVAVEDPVTGSLNAGLAQWLLGSGRVEAPYVAAQGTAIGRHGRVHVSRDPDGTIWIGGDAVTCITGEIDA